MTTNLSEQIISEVPMFRITDVGQYVTLYYDSMDAYPRRCYLTPIQQLTLRQMVRTDRVRFHRSNLVVCTGGYFVAIVPRLRMGAYIDWVKRNLLDGKGGRNDI